MGVTHTQGGTHGKKFSKQKFGVPGMVVAAPMPTVLAPQVIQQPAFASAYAGAPQIAYAGAPQIAYAGAPQIVGALGTPITTTYGHTSMAPLAMTYAAAPVVSPVPVVSRGWAASC